MRCARQNASIFRIISTENTLKEEPTFSTRLNVLVPFEKSFSKQGIHLKANDVICENGFPGSSTANLSMPI